MRKIVGCVFFVEQKHAYSHGTKLKAIKIKRATIPVNEMIAVYRIKDLSMYEVGKRKASFKVVS